MKMRLFSRLCLLLSVVAPGLSAPIAGDIVERQDATALAKLQAVALIKEYELQFWCEEWLLDLDTGSKYFRCCCITNGRRDRIVKGRTILEDRDVAMPAALALFPADTISQACADVIGITL
jgi:hypothetical protein